MLARRSSLRYAVAVADDRLGRYVSNLDRDVFALRNLPEEVVAVLFAYYSRSRDDLRSNLRKLLDDQELSVLDGADGAAPPLATAQDKARAFHEKWVVGYGHSSVAEHAVVHLAVERCSIVAAKALEDARLAAYTEKSTRYVRFDEGTLVSDIGLPPELARRYEATGRHLLRVYTGLLDVVENRLFVRHPTPEGVNPKAHAATLKAHACDLLRGMLPAGVPTNVGITANARVLEQHISKLLGSPLAEVRRIAEALRDEGRTVTPTLLKYTAPRPHRDHAAARVLHAHGALHPVGRDNPEDVTLIDRSPEPLRVVATAIQCELFGTPWNDAWAGALDPSHARAIFDAYMAERGPHDAPGRALEQVWFRFEIACDYGAWRDLQRHRLVSASTPRLTAREGYTLSPELDALGVGRDVRAALDGVAPVYEAIAATHPWEAQYLVPLAFRVRYLATMNLRELFHLTELRAARQGHPAYRRVAQAIARHAIDHCPWLESHLRIDWEDHPFARH
jgi:thymidylate synthase ThyX